MAKKDFSNINTERASNIGRDIEQATGKKRQQGTASPEEAAQRAAEGRTQGRKGCAGPRISVVWTTENADFLREASKLMGLSMTKLANIAVQQYRENHEEGWKELRAVRDKYNLF